ncbi:MAG: DNA-binding protein WhiA [Ezakiella sp.]|nr:DNA-binding protein WhiA [Ezakiella sp.]
MKTFRRQVKDEILNRTITRGDELACELIGYLSCREKIENKIIKGELDDEYLNYIGDIRLSSDFNIIIEGNSIEIKSEFNLDEFIIKADHQMKRAYVRGAFIGGGSVSDPKSEYHAEFNFKDEKNALLLSDIFAELGIKSAIIKRQSASVCYIKESDSISDLLIAMGARSMTLQFEDIVVMKSARNDVNRRVNCETANLSKTVTAALRQVEAIEKLQRSGRFEMLERPLYETGLLRLANPDASLNELTILSGGKLTRSGINHRLNKLIELAENVEEI